MVIPSSASSLSLNLQPAGIAGERAVRTDDAVAGDDDRDRVAVVGHADGTAGARIADGGGELAIGARLAIGDGAQRRPDPLLKCGAARGERQVECPPRARKVFPQLRLGRVEQGRGVLRAVRAEADGRDGGFVRLAASAGR